MVTKLELPESLDIVTLAGNETVGLTKLCVAYIS